MIDLGTIVILGAGAAATAASQVGQFFFRSRKNEALVRLERSSPLVKGMASMSPEQALLVMKGILTETLAALEKKRSMINWLQNFFWFTMGSFVSLFSTELRSLVGLP